MKDTHKYAEENDEEKERERDKTTSEIYTRSALNATYIYVESQSCVMMTLLLTPSTTGCNIYVRDKLI